MERTSIYRFYDPAGALLYVGITKTPPTRFRNHAKEKPGWPQVARIEIEWCETRADAEERERKAIQSEQPKWNVVHARRGGGQRGVHDTGRLEALGIVRMELTSLLEANRPQLHAEVLAAHDGGIGTVEIARLAGITRDAVRQIINKRDNTKGAKQ